MYNFAFTPAAVGSGKTYRAAQWMRDNPNENVLYIVPTKRLSRGVIETVREVAPRRRHVNQIDRDAYNGQCSVHEKALSVINNVHTHAGRTLILTFHSFVRLMSEVRNPTLWNIILDEAFPAIEHLPFESSDMPELVDKYFTVEKLGGLAGIQPGQEEKFAAAYANNYRGIAELTADKLPDFIGAVMNPARELRLFKQVGETQDGKNNYWHGFAFTNPELFSCFKSVLVMSAMFDGSLLKRIWEKRFGVTWTEHEYWADISNSTHTRFGDKVKIGHLLPDGRGASLSLLNTINEDGTKVVASLIDAVVDYFGSTEYAISINNRHQRLLKSKGFKDVDIVPVKSHGMNEWKTIDNIAVLAITNPTKEFVQVVKIILDDMKKPEIAALLRRESIYQIFGRISIRDRNSVTDKKVIIAGAEDAQFFHELFEGSTWLGRVAEFDVPKMKSNYKPVKKKKTPKNGDMTRAEVQAWEYFKKTKKYNPALSKKAWLAARRGNQLVKELAAANTAN